MDDRYELKITYVRVINLNTLVFEAYIRKGKKKEFLSFITNYFLFTIGDLIDVLIAFIKEFKEITIELEGGRDFLISDSFLDILEDTINKYLNNESDITVKEINLNKQKGE